MNLNNKILKKIEYIKCDRNHGASELSTEAVATMILAAKLSSSKEVGELISELKSLGSKIIRLRPSMISIFNNVAEFMTKVLECDEKRLDEFKIQVVKIGTELNKHYKESIIEAAKEAQRIIKPDSTLITHSRSSTVIEVLRLMRNIKVIATESRPLFEGRTLAEECVKLGIPITLVVDAAAGLFTTKSDLAVVGADRIGLDGSLINKIGTYPLALAAADNDIPFYVCCESNKIDIRENIDSRIMLEEMDGREIYDGRSPINVKNVYFDCTPSSLVTGIITEDGVLKPSEVRSFALRRKHYLKWLKN